jgi:hypothetical protein
MNLASGLAQREREGPLWRFAHRRGAKTTFVVPPPSAPTQSNSSSSDDDAESQPTFTAAATGHGEPAPLQPKTSSGDEPSTDSFADGSLWRLHKATSSTQLRTNSSFMSRYPRSPLHVMAATTQHAHACLTVIVFALARPRRTCQASPGQAPQRAPRLRQQHPLEHGGNAAHHRFRRLQAGTQALTLPIHLPRHRVIGVLVCGR